jgi:hypothetical protein
MRIADLQAPIDNPSEGEPLADWRWLVEEDAVPVLVTALGDVFVRNDRGEIWWLDTYGGRYDRASLDESTWRMELEDPTKVQEWFVPDLIASLREGGLEPEPGECFSPILPPTVGGNMNAGNFECSPWLLHVSLAGQLHQESRKHADGTPITAFVDEAAAQPAVAADGTSPRR